jgi:hypothetical protein
LEDHCSSTSSTAGHSRPLLSASSWREQSPAMLPDISLTSFVRPSMRSASALCVYTAASGSVPVSVHDGGSPGLQIQLDGGQRERPDCFVQAFSKVFSTFIRDLYVISSFYGVLCKILYCHRLMLM